MVIDIRIEGGISRQGDDDHRMRVTAREGESVLLEASVKEFRSGRPFKSLASLSFEWLKDTRRLPLGPRIKLLDRKSLKINSLLRADRGMYQLIVKWVFHEWRSSVCSESMSCIVNLTFSFFYLISVGIIKQLSSVSLSFGNNNLLPVNVSRQFFVSSCTSFVSMSQERAWRQSSNIHRWTSSWRWVKRHRLPFLKREREREDKSLSTTQVSVILRRTVCQETVPLERRVFGKLFRWRHQHGYSFFEVKQKLLPFLVSRCHSLW